uniref:DNA (cytosine-5-)-methyltransferase n=1 Tax=Zooxanthella nutricula TaxID=1333877 RepID=A0A7S2M1X4_9DINO
MPQQRERVYMVGLRKDACVGPMDWTGLCGEGGDTSGRAVAGDGGSVRGILEPAESAAVAVAEISAEQWAALQRQFAARGCTLREREIALDGKAPPLISGYRNVGNITAKYICEEADGTRRDGGERRPRFLTPRECARLMGLPEWYRIPGDGLGFYKQAGNAVCPPVVEAVGERLLAALGL